MRRFIQHFELARDSRFVRQENVLATALSRLPDDVDAVVAAFEQFDPMIEKSVRGTAAEVWNRLLGSDGFAREGRIEGLKEGDRYRVKAATGDAFEGRDAVVVLVVPGVEHGQHHVRAAEARVLRRDGPSHASGFRTDRTRPADSPQGCRRPDPRR